MYLLLFWFAKYFERAESFNYRGWDRVDEE